MNFGLSIRRSTTMSISSGMVMAKVIISPTCLVTRGGWIRTFAVTLAILPGPWAIGPISNSSPAISAMASPTRCSLTAYSKNWRPNCS